MNEGIFAAYWISKDQIVILHKRLFGSLVEFAHGVCYLQCELGPECDFHILGPL